MATLNVGNMAIRLGVDPALLLEELEKIPGYVSASGKRMAAEWKAAQKAMRDDALETAREEERAAEESERAWINHSKNVERAALETARVQANAARAAARAQMEAAREGQQAARIVLTELTGNFMLARLLAGALPPGITGALAGTLGTVVGGAIAYGGFELYQKISRDIEKAQKAQEEFEVATKKADKTLEDMVDHYELKVAKLDGQRQFATIISEGAADARHEFEQIEKAMDDMAKKGEALKGIGHEIATAILNALDVYGRGLGIISKEDDEHKRAGRSLGFLGQNIDEAFRIDTKEHSHTAKDLINLETRQVEGAIRGQREGPNFDPKSQHFEDLLARQDFLEAAAKNEAGRESGEDAAKRKVEREDAAKAAREAAAEAKRRHAEEMRDASELGRAFEAANKKLDPDAESENKFRERVALINRVIQQTSTGSFEGKFGIGASGMKGQFRADTDLEEVENFMKRTGELIPGIAKVKGGLAGSPDLGGIGMPGLNDTGRVAALFDEFQRNAKEQDAFGKSFEKKSLDPGQNLQLYLLKLGSMKLSEEDLTAAKQKGMDAWVQETNAIDKQEKALERLMKRSDDASAGIQAFFTKFSKDSQENGRFAFQILDSSVKGFENSLAFAVTNGTRGWSQQWKNLAKQLEGQIFKFSLDKALVAGGHALGGTGIGQTISKVLGLGKDPAQAALVAAESANTAATIANTAALGFATVGKGASAGPGGAIGALIAQWGGGGGGGAAASTGGSFEGPFALGGSVGPGSSFIAGESGAEEISLGSSGGANIKPIGGGGGDHYHNYDFRGAVVTDDLLRKADAARMMNASENRGVARSVSMNQEIARRGRAR